jgi:hypothetical protein
MTFLTQIMMFISFISPFSFAKESEEPLPKAIISENQHIIKTLPLNFYSRYTPKNMIINLDINGKIGYLQSEEQLEYLLNKYQDVYNSQWVREY